MTTLICDCNQTMPLDARRLGDALNETLPLHSTLCRREAGAFVKAMQDGQPLVVACTQEQRLFSELAEQAKVAVPIHFVNIRETAGWSREAAQATPKMAALLAMARLPEPEPVGTVSYQSSGRLLIIGPLGLAEQAAALLGEGMDITLFSQGVGAHDVSQARNYPVLGGKIQTPRGYLGAFTLEWQSSNPIDLDLCTRCNACVAACPESAIGLDYQVDQSLCQSHRSCVKACKVAGAIDFQRQAQAHRDTFDLVVDLRATPAFSQHALPQGYLRWDGQALAPLMQLRAMVGEFEKPKFFHYKQKLCAHSRNEKTGCTACVDVCSASAIQSDRSRQQIKVDPHLCVGCGTCSTVCPSGALAFQYPSAPAQGVKLKTLLATYARAGGQQAALLLHSQAQGARMVADLGRAAQLDADLRGLPARVLPFPLWHNASTGLDLWLAAICYGATQVWVLLTGEEAPQYVQALQEQMDVGQALLTGLGLHGRHFALLHARDARDLAALDQSLQAAPAQGLTRTAGFAVQADKRATLELALGHLLEQSTGGPLPDAPPQREAIALPAAGSPFGTLAINKEACTLCLSCVSACPSMALQDNPQALQLRFIEKNCVQCGLCAKTCPEQAIQLVPRLSLEASRREAVVLNEMQPYACIRCNKPFGTLKAIEGMLGKLAGHSMFQGAALERLKMCGDCRVIDIYSADNEIKITDINP